MRGFVSNFCSLLQVYGEGFEEHTAIITLAPELPGALDEIQRLTEKGVVCSIGHSEATLKDGERAVRAGAKFITHLFNAMLPVTDCMIDQF